MAKSVYDLFSQKPRRLRVGRLALTGGLVLAVLSLAAACGGGGGGGETPVAETPSGETPAAETPAAQQLSAVVISSDIAVGSNRFMVGLVTPDNQIVTDADVQFAFFKVAGNQAEPRSEADATTIKMTRGIVQEEPEGSRVMLEVGETAAYVAQADFDEPGDWGVRISITRDGRALEPIQLAFTVQEEERSAAVGQLAPSSRQLTLADASDVTEICTSDRPKPEWHDTTIAEAVESGKPVLIAFSTPGFCETQMCAPMTREMEMLYDKYGDRAIFIHVEPYSLDKARSGEGLFPVPVMGEWGFQTEPWIVVVDAEGKVAAKFEAFVMANEIESALQVTLGEGGSNEGE